MRSKILSIKSDQGYVNAHPFDLSNVVDLPKAISNPIAVFDSKTRDDSKVVFTELKQDGVNMVVAMQINANPKGYQKGIEVNDIRSLYPKDNIQDLFNWISQGDLIRYVDKNKMLNWITQQRSNSADVAIPIKHYDSATKVIESFENPKLSAQINNNNTSLGNNPSPLDAAKRVVADKRVLDQSIRDKASEISEKLGVKINVVESSAEIKDDNPNRLRRKRRAKGWFTPSTGEVTIVLSNATSLEDALSTILHEAVGHKGLRELLGEHFDTFLDNIYNNVEQTIREKIDARGEDKRIATEEYMAELAEKGAATAQELSAWSKVKELFVKLLSKVGINLKNKLSDADLRYIIWKSYNKLKENASAIETAQYVAKEYELKERFNDPIATDNVGAFNPTNDDIRYKEEDSSATPNPSPIEKAYWEMCERFDSIQIGHNRWGIEASGGAPDVETIDRVFDQICQKGMMVAAGVRNSGFASSLIDVLPKERLTTILGSAHVSEYGKRMREYVMDVLNAQYSAAEHEMVVEHFRKLSGYSRATGQNFISAWMALEDKDDPLTVAKKVAGASKYQAETSARETTLKIKADFDKEIARMLRFKSMSAENIFDDVISVKKLQEMIEEASGEKIVDAANLYQFWTTMGSRRDFLVKEFAYDKYQPLMATLRDLNSKGVNMEDASNYLFAKHIPERNDYMRNRERQAIIDKEMKEIDQELIQKNSAVDPTTGISKLNDGYDLLKDPKREKALQKIEKNTPMPKTEYAAQKVFEEDVVDQQRYVNRLITMVDFIVESFSCSTIYENH